MISNLVGKQLIIKEKISAPIIIVERVGKNLNIYKKHLKPITLIDRILTKLYEYPIRFFEKVDMNLFKENKYYYFNYIFDSTPVDITYSNIPPNNLILSNIINVDGTYCDLDNENIEYFKKQNTIYNSVLTEHDEFIYKSKEEIIQRYNQGYKSVLGNHNCSTIFFNIIDNNRLVKTFKSNFKTNTTRHTSDINSIIIVDIINFVNRFDIESIYTKFKDDDLIFVDFVYQLYSNYIKYRNPKIDIREEFDKPVFKLNKKFFKKTIQNEELFKLMLNIFNKDKDYNSPFIKDINKTNLKNIINRLKTRLEIVKKISNESDFYSFEEFFN